MRPATSPSREELIAIDQYLRPLAASVIAFSKRERRSPYWANWLAESRLYEPLFYLTMEGNCPDDFSACEKRLFRLLRRALDADWAAPRDDTFARRAIFKAGGYLGDDGLDPVWWESKMKNVQRFKSHLVRNLLQINGPPRENAKSGPGVKERLYEAILEYGDEVAKMQLAAHFFHEEQAPFYWKERLLQSAKEPGVRHTLVYALDPEDKEERKLLEVLSRDPDDEVRLKVADKVIFPHMLEDPNPEVRIKAVKELPLTREQASRLVEDPCPFVRQTLLEKALFRGKPELTVEELFYLYDTIPEKKAHLYKLLREKVAEQIGTKEAETVFAFMEI